MELLDVSGPIEDPRDGPDVTLTRYAPAEGGGGGGPPDDRPPGPRDAGIVGGVAEEDGVDLGNDCVVPGGFIIGG